MVALVAIFSLVLWYFLTGSTTTSSNRIESQKTDYLSCNKVGDNEEYVLLSELDYSGSTIEIRTTIVNDAPEQYTFIVSKKFASQEDAKTYTDTLHANYNIYTGEKNISNYGLSPSYSYVDNTGKMALSVSATTVNSLTAPLIMLDDSTITANATELKNHFENLGFMCNLK